MPNEFILDSMRWSFSSVNAYNTCPHMFKLQYIDCVPRQNNAFAQYGTQCHSVLERYFNGKLELFEQYDAYRREYKKEVTNPFPYNRFADLGERYFEAGENYFSGFDGQPDGVTVVATEEKVETQIEGYNFVGYIDLILRDGDGYHIVDHKSKSGFKSIGERDAYLRQLYLYSIYVKEKYGEFPRTQSFNMFRAGTVITVPFEQGAYDEALEWFTGTIRKIYEDTVFGALPNDYFCRHICSARESCEEG